MFFILKAQESFSGKAAIGMPIFLYILYNIFYASFSIPLGILSDKIGRKNIIVSGYLLFSITCLGFVFFKNFYALIILFILYGMVRAMTEGNQRAYITDLANEKIRASILGLFHTTIGVLTLISSLVAGFLWQNIKIEASFIYGSIFSFCSVFLFFILKKQLK